MKNNIGLSLHASTALQQRWGYVKGTYGKILTPEYLEQKIAQYPEIEKKRKIIEELWINKNTVDCIGFFKSYLWWNEAKDEPVYPKSTEPKTDYDADDMFKIAEVKGKIDSIPEILGLGVYKNGHVGIYMLNGVVIESKGTSSGVVKTPLKGSKATKWTNWFEYPFIRYIRSLEEAKAIIQENMRFSHPDLIWNFIKNYQYYVDWLYKWCRSYIE